MHSYFRLNYFVKFHNPHKLIKKKLIVSGIEREIVQIISDISLTTIRFLFPTLYSTLYPYHGQRHFST